MEGKGCRQLLMTARRRRQLEGWSHSEKKGVQYSGLEPNAVAALLDYITWRQNDDISAIVD